MTEREKRIEQWRSAHKDHIKEYRREYYEKTKDQPKESEGVLRECSCGVAALVEEDLSLFVKDPYSKYGHRNKCLECSARDARNGKEKAKPCKTCSRCHEVTIGVIEINKNFRQCKATGGKLYGDLAPQCKHCEFPKDLYYEIDGKFVLKQGIPKGIHNKPLEAM